jgi:nucleoside-diphosphate-sugar epimerase
MRIFLTGATGFIGTHVIPELLAGGHQVLGLTRSDTGEASLRAAGVEPYRGALEDADSLKAGAAQADAVIHCAFDHDFSNFIANTQKDARVIRAMGEALQGSDRLLLITSGTGIGAPGPGELAVESVTNFDHPNPRIASEQAGVAAAEAGAKVAVMRLPPVHDTREKGRVSYIGDGANRWAAAHVSDVARLYVLAIEQGRGGDIFHAVDEEGVCARDIAEALGRGLGLPVDSVSPEQAAEAFGWMAMFAGLDMPASSAWTRQRLGWTPKGPGLIADLDAMDYSAV